MLYLLFASFFYVFFNGISDPLVADCLNTKSKQKSQDWIFSLKNHNYFNKIPKLTPFGRRTASGFGRKYDWLSCSLIIAATQTVEVFVRFSSR